MCGEVSVYFGGRSAVNARMLDIDDVFRAVG